MPKVLVATCVGGVVKVGSTPVEAAEILSQGDGESTGILIMDRDLVRYLTSNASDIADVIDSLGDIIDQIATIATGIDAATNAPGAQAAAIAQLTTLKTQFVLLKDQLK